MTDTSFDTLSLDIDDHRASLTIQRPDQLNSLNVDVLRDLDAACEQLAEREALRVLTIEGEGRAFIAGADIPTMKEGDADAREAFVDLGHRVTRNLTRLDVPVVAGVDGFALGGGLEVALACDIVVASRRAEFGLPETSLGLIPGFGGTQRLARFVGWHRAREIVLTARRVDAAEAHQIGLVSRLFDVDTFDDKLDELVQTLASRAPIATRAAKEVMRRGADVGIDEALDGEREVFLNVIDTDDAEEGMAAFLESRTPEFSGS
jgi:enoyl-CoA hydratase